MLNMKLFVGDGDTMENMDEKQKELQMQQRINQEEYNQNRRKNVILIFIFLFLFFFSLFGLTYSINKGNGTEPIIIETGEIIFSYSDADHAGNGIDIRDAVPIPDSSGKTLLGNRQYFDFSVTATSRQKDISYQLLAKKLELSSLSNSQLRIYLVSLTGNYEEEVLLKDFSELETRTINGIEYYLLYEKTLTKGVVNHSDFYRLRMWVKDGSTDFLNKTFSIRVVAHAVQVGE